MKAYTEYVTTFIDVLGFKNLVAEKSAEEIGAILSRLQTMTEGSEYEKLVMGRGTIAFSDSIVRTSALAMPSGDAARYGILFHELLSLVHAQMDLIARHGVFLRGAVSIGQAYHEGTTIFGPGLIRAYETESELALFPRVILDPVVLKKYTEEGSTLKAGHHSLKQDTEYVSKLIREDADGVWFVDYLKAVASELDEPEAYPGVVLRHKEAILEAAKGQGALNKVSQKYNWLARYHNRVAEEIGAGYFGENGVAMERVLITPKEMLTLTALTGGQ